MMPCPELAGYITVAAHLLASAVLRTSVPGVPSSSGLLPFPHLSFALLLPAPQSLSPRVVAWFLLSTQTIPVVDFAMVLAPEADYLGLFAQMRMMLWSGPHSDCEATSAIPPGWHVLSHVTRCIAHRNCTAPQDSVATVAIGLNWDIYSGVGSEDSPLQAHWAAPDGNPLPTRCAVPAGFVRLPQFACCGRFLLLGSSA
jgi:hypothetical protein